MDEIEAQAIEDAKKQAGEIFNQDVLSQLQSRLSGGPIAVTLAINADEVVAGEKIEEGQEAVKTAFEKQDFFGNVDSAQEAAEQKLEGLEQLAGIVESSAGYGFENPQQHQQGHGIDPTLAIIGVALIAKGVKNCLAPSQNEKLLPPDILAEVASEHEAFNRNPTKGRNR